MIGKAIAKANIMFFRLVKAVKAFFFFAGVSFFRRMSSVFLSTTNVRLLGNHVIAIIMTQPTQAFPFYTWDVLAWATNLKIRAAPSRTKRLEQAT